MHNIYIYIYEIHIIYSWVTASESLSPPCGEEGQLQQDIKVRINSTGKVVAGVKPPPPQQKLKQTSPRWDSPIGPLVSGLAMMIRTPGRICPTETQHQHSKGSVQTQNTKGQTHLPGLHQRQAVGGPPLHQPDPGEQTHTGQLTRRAGSRRTVPVGS